MSFENLRAMTKIAALAAISWSLPPRLWRRWHWLQPDRPLRSTPPSAVANAQGPRRGPVTAAWLVEKVLRSAQLIVRFMRHARDLTPLLFPARGSSLHRVILKRPGTVVIALTRYLASNWDTRTRVARIVEHHKIVDQIGGLVNCKPNDIVDLLKLDRIDPRYRLTLDQADWLMREGSLIFSLWDGADRIFHLGFCLANENGRRVAYVGSLQGRRKFDPYGGPFDLLACYRQFTKAASGMRPRDFLVEAFKMFCNAIDVDEIRAVCNDNQPQRQIDRDIKLSYDAVWSERGGRREDDGFFSLPTTWHRRPLDEIPAKKRARYAQRYAMLDEIDREIRAALCEGNGTAAGYAAAA